MKNANGTSHNSGYEVPLPSVEQLLLSTNRYTQFAELDMGLFWDLNWQITK